MEEIQKSKIEEQNHENKFFTKNRKKIENQEKMKTV